jgi:hypothetical protein
MAVAEHGDDGDCVVWHEGGLAAPSRSRMIPDMSTVSEVETALEKFSPAQMREVADWIAARLLPEEPAEVLMAIDAGLRSLEAEPTLTADQVREQIAIWTGK